MDRLEAMSLLVAAVEAGSLSAASRRLGVPLATVSRKVSDLEDHLQTQLLIRSTRQLTLTDAGRSYVIACKRILEDVGEAERAAMGEYRAPKGDLIITAPIVFGRLHVLPVVVQFLKTYPDIDIRLLLADRIAHLLDEHIDLAVRIGPLPDSSLVATTIGEIRQVVCASPAYLKLHGTPKVPADLAKHDCISFDSASSAKSWVFSTGKSKIDVRLRSRLSVNTAEAAVDAALAGAGITRVLSYQMAAAAEANRLKILLRDFEPAPWPVNLFYAEQGQLPLKLRAFIDFAAPRLRESLTR